MCQLYADNKPLSLSHRTSYKAFLSKLEWNEWMQIPFEIADLPPSAVLVFTLLDIAAPAEELIIGGSTMPLFGENG